MKLKKVIAVLLAAAAVLFSVPVSAAESPAYGVLAAEEPVYQRELTLSELEEFYIMADTDTILDPAECNYTYGEVSVGGVAELCHVYMRTFVITDVEDLTIYDMEALAKRIVSLVKRSSASKYLKCIAKTYNARISRMVQAPGGVMDSVTVKIFIACGEKTEDRQKLKQEYIAGIANELMPLTDGQRFIRMNELMLDGRFRYDMTYRHRCSAVSLVNDGAGVCEEYAGFTSLLLDALGYENSVITGEVGGVAHMWNLVNVGGRLYHLDILHNGPINAEGEHTSVLRTYLLVSEQTITSTHTISDIYIDQAETALYDYIFEGYPEELPYDGEINGVRYIFAKSNTTLSGLEELYSAAGFLRVTGKNGTLGGDDAAGSGCTVDIYVNGVVLASYLLCVRGDADGDGLVTENDVADAAAYLLGDTDGRGDPFILAADLDGNGTVTVTDLVMIADIAEGRYTEPEDGGDETEPGAETEAEVTEP